MSAGVRGSLRQRGSLLLPFGSTAYSAPGAPAGWVANQPTKPGDLWVAPNGAVVTPKPGVASTGATYVYANFAPVQWNKTGPRIGFVGDSIPVLNGTGSSLPSNPGFDNTVNNYVSHLCVLSKGALEWWGVAGAGGYTLAQIRTGPLAALLAQDPRQFPARVVVSGGTNDIGSGARPFNLALSAADLESICNDLLAAGIWPALILVPPRGDSTTANIAAQCWNTYIQQYAASRGYEVVDLWTPCVDPATGGFLAGYSSDGVHPSPLGMYAIAANAIAKGFGSRGVPASLLALTDGESLAANLVTRPLFDADSNADGIADTWGWSNAGTGTSFSLVNPVAGDGIAGKWQQIARAAGATGTATLQFIYQAVTRTVTDGAISSNSPTLTSATAAFTSADVGRPIQVNGAGVNGGPLQAVVIARVSATQVTLSVNASTTVANATTAIDVQPGDLLAMKCRVQTTGIGAAGYGSGSGFDLAFQSVKASDQSLYGSSQDVDGVVYLERVVPAGFASGYQVALSVDLGAPPSGAVSLRIGALSIRNLTRFAGLM